MKKVTCPYCGTVTDQGICPRCRAEVPRETEDAPVVEKQTVKRKKNKEDE